MDTTYRTLQDFFRSVGLPLQQEMELTVHRLEGLHGDKPMQAPFFRTDYYSFLLITDGKGVYHIDNHTFEVQRYTYYFTTPGHLKSFKIEQPLGGFMLTFSEKFVKQYFVGDFLTLFPFLIEETTPSMTLDDSILASLSIVFEQMLAEYESNTPYKNAILINQLSILLYKTKALWLSHKNPLKVNNRASELVNQFKKMMHENFKNLLDGNAQKVLSIKEYAERLHLHPNYLSNIIKEETGKSASEWLQDRTLAEAQSLLRNSTQSVSEIAFTLGFTDAAHFAKFIKKHTALSPSQYREKANL